MTRAPARLSRRFATEVICLASWSVLDEPSGRRVPGFAYFVPSFFCSTARFDVQDLLLFALLADRDFDDERMPALLDELGSESLRDRTPFFGALVTLAEDERANVELRRRALVALRGATGLLTIETAVDCLSEPALANDAVRVLAHVARSEAARWAHVVFHERAEVRALGLELSRAGEAPREWDLLLVADPAHRDEILCDAENGALAPPSGLALLIDLARNKTLTPPAAWGVLRAKPALLGGSHDKLRLRTAAIANRFLGTVSAEPDFSIIDKVVDELDDLLRVIPDDPHDPIEKTMHAASTVQAQIAASAWLDIRARGTTPSRLHLLALFHPPSFLSPKLDRADLRTGAALWHRWHVHYHSAVVEPLLARAVREDGRLDLYVATGIVRLCDKKPFHRLAEAVTPELLTMALLEEPMEDVVALLSLQDENDEGRSSTLGLIPATDERRTRGAVLAAMLLRAPTHLFPFIAAAPQLRAAMQDAQLKSLDAERSALFARAVMATSGAEVIPRVLGELCNVGAADSTLARVTLVEASLTLETDDFVGGLLALDKRSMGPRGGVLAELLQTAPPGALALGKELALAERLRDHADERLAAWAAERTPAPAPTAAAARQRQGVAYKSPPPMPSVETCVSLLGSMDPVAATDEAFAKVSNDSPSFLEDLDRAMARAYGPTNELLSPLGHAWLWRWDAHALAHLYRGLEDHASLAALVHARVALVSPPLRKAATHAIASAIGILAWRQRPRFLELVDDAALLALVAALRTDASLGAASALRNIARARQHDLSATAHAVRLMLPDLDTATREMLGPLVEAEGLLPRRPVRVEPRTDEALLAEIRKTKDLDALVRLTGDERTSVVHEATLRLVEMGDEGCRRLTDRLAATDDPRAVRPIIDSIPLWPEGDAKLRALALADDGSRPEELRFRIALADIECGGAGGLDRAIAIAHLPSREPFFEEGDWEALARASSARDLPRRLASSPQPHAYLRAVEILIAEPPTPDGFAALRGFLDIGTRRMGALRRRVALHLHMQGDDHGFPLVLGQCLEESSGRPHLFDRTRTRTTLLGALTFLAAGLAIAKEAALVHHLTPVPGHIAEPALEAVMTHGITDKARMAAARMLSTRAARERKLIRIAEVFAWGQRIAQRALGKPMRIRMTGTQKLGFTRTRQDAIFVTPLPILRGDPHGQEVVAALILHELGHHLYHAGPAAEKVWKRAEDAGLHGVFNLVADEHLERNLRALDSRWGDLLKRLAAYAFQHTDRNVPVLALVSHLGARAFEVLSQTRLGVSRDDKSVKVDSGGLLFTMERVGLSFARFARALRMGLGNRHDDPKVEQALDLFAHKFRQSSMEDLWSITLELRDIFGFETKLCDSIGPHEELEEGGVDGLVWNDGISQEEIDSLIERVANPEGRPRSATGKPSGKLYLNVDPETKFDLIKEVRPVPFDPVAYAPYRRKVDRPASVLRSYLEELGLSFTQRRMLVSGRRIDRPRLMPLALHGDPRALKSRETKPHRDLYLGVIVDCSGSMASRENIERAKLFGALVVEAARPLSEVDVRVIGFTDRVIFDCGPKERAAVHALAAGGGNNDSAALYHAATQAKGSRRKAKVLVMISDGLPTECSVASLKNLVTHLTKRERMVVAQVAVQPLAERCFPHYVVLTDASIEVTVRKFGQIIAGLVQKAMAG